MRLTFFKIGVAALLVLIGQNGLAQPSLSVNVKDAEALKDVVEVRAEASSGSGIVKVEFSVDDQLRATLMKQPYVYKWDTVDEQEGPHTLIVAVFDGDGKTAKKRIKVEVDNGLSQGAKVIAARALDLFRKGELEKATLDARKAFRLNRVDLEATLAMAATVGMNGDFNRGIDLLEKQPVIDNQPAGEAKNYPMSDLLSVQLRALFRVMRSATKPNVVEILPDLTAAYELSRRAQEMLLAVAAADKSPAGSLRRGDAHYYRGEYAAALSAYEKLANDLKFGITAQNHMALSLIQLGRIADADKLLTAIASSGKANSATRALQASLLLRQRKFSKVLKDMPTSPTRLADQLIVAHAELASYNYRRAFELLQQASEKAVLPEVHYLVGAIFTEDGKAPLAQQHAMMGLRLNNLALDLYAQRAFQVLQFDPKDSGIAQALPLFEFVLQRDPTHPSARMGKALILIQQRRKKQAEALLKELNRDDKTAGDVYVGFAMLYSDEADNGKSTEALAQARLMDPDRFKDIVVPKFAEIVPRIARYRRLPFLTPALLSFEDAVDARK